MTQAISGVPAKASRRFPWEWAALLGTILFVAVVRINLIQIPYERDDGAYIYFGQMILEGQTPYRDFYEDKPPGNMYSYALLVGVFGPNEGSQHAAFMLMNIATLLLMYIVMKRMFDAAAALCGAFAFAALSLSRSLAGFTCQSEHIVILFAAAGLAALLAWEDDPPVWSCALAGAAMGLSCWVKQSGVFFVLWGAAVTLLPPARTSGPSRRARAFGAYAGGVALVSLIFAGGMARLGVFREFWFSAVELPRLFITSALAPAQIRAQFLRSAGDIARMNSVNCLLVLAGLALLPFSGLSRGRKFAVGLLAACSLAAVVPGFMFYNHYWLQMLPVSAVAVGLAISALSKAVSVLLPGPRRGRAIAASLFALAMAHSNFRKRGYYFGDDYDPVLRETFGMNPFSSAKAVGDYLRLHTRPGEKIAIFGSEPEIFMYARCRNATRHAFVSHFLESRNPYSAAWQDEYIADIEKTAPRYFVVVQNPWSIGGDGKTGKKVFDWLESYVPKFYDRVGTIDDSAPGEATPRLLWGKSAQAAAPPAGLWSVEIYRRKA